MSKALMDRVREAVEHDPGICVTRAQAGTHKGFSDAYMEAHGLELQDLKRLERKGLALRGYTKNVWLPGERTKNVQEHEKDYVKDIVYDKVTVQVAPHTYRSRQVPRAILKPVYTERGPGSRRMWVLLKEAE